MKNTTCDLDTPNLAEIVEPYMKATTAKAGGGGCRTGCRGGGGWGKNAHVVPKHSKPRFPTRGSWRLARGVRRGGREGSGCSLLEHHCPVDVPPPPKPALSSAAVNHCFLCSHRRRRRKLHCTVRHRYKTMPRPHASHVSAHHGAFLRIPSQGSTATENNGTMGIIWESHLLSVTHVPLHTI